MQTCGTSFWRANWGWGAKHSPTSKNSGICSLVSQMSKYFAYFGLRVQRCKQNKHAERKVHLNSLNLEFLPGGPPQLEKKRRVLRTTWDLLFCAAARRTCPKWDPKHSRDSPKPQKCEKLDFLKIRDGFGVWHFACHFWIDIIPVKLPFQNVKSCPGRWNREAELI